MQADPVLIGDVLGPKAAVADNRLSSWNGTSGNALQQSSLADGVSGGTLSFSATLTSDRSLSIPDQDVTITAFGASLIDDANAVSGRNTLGLGTGDSPTFAGLTVNGDVTARSSADQTIALGRSNDGSSDEALEIRSYTGAAEYWLHRYRGNFALVGTNDYVLEDYDITSAATITEWWRCNAATGQFDISVPTQFQRRIRCLDNTESNATDEGSIIAYGGLGLALNLNVGGNATVEGDVFADVIGERTEDSGVTIDGLLIKDGAVDGLEIGTDVQAYDADLSAIAALSSTNGNFIVGSAGGWVAESGNTARTSLGLGTGDSPTFDGLNSTGAIKSTSDSVGNNSAFLASGETAVYSWQETDAAVDEKWYDIIASNGALKYRLVNDAINSVTNYFTIERTGMTVDSVSIGGSILNVAGVTNIDDTTEATTGGAAALVVDGGANIAKRTIAGGYIKGTASGISASIPGTFIAEAAVPAYAIYETDAATDEGRWDISGGTGALRFRAVNDAITAADTFLQIHRSGASVTSAAWSCTIDLNDNDLIDIGDAVFSGDARSNITTEAALNYETGQDAFGSYTNGVFGWMRRTLFSAYADVTHTAAVTSQSLRSATAKGTATLPANWWKQGKRLHYRLSGVHTTDASPGNVTVTIKLGSTTFRTTGSFAPTASASDAFWRLEGEIVCQSTGATGSVQGCGAFEHVDSAGTNSPLDAQSFNSASAVTIDTTASMDFDVEWTADDAGTSITCTEFTLEEVS